MSQTKAQLIDPVDGTIVNADINASAAIAGTKISPNFGSQNTTTTGIAAVGELQITSTAPKITFFDSDTNPDYEIRNLNGVLHFKDVSSTAVRMQINTDGHVDILGNLDVGAGLDVTGAITGTAGLTIEGATVFNDAGADVDFRVEGNSITNLFKVDASVDNIGIGMASPKFSSGNGIELADNFFLGFGSGNGTRPDFQFGTTAGATLDIRCGTGADTVDLVINTNGFLGIGTTSPSRKLDVDSSFIRVSDGYGLDTGGSSERVTLDNGFVSVNTNSVERMRIDSSGRMLIGHTTSTPMDNDANNPIFAVEGTGNGARIAVRSDDSTASNGAFIYLTRTRGTSVGSKTTVQSGDSLGGFIFMGADGTHDTRAAIIQAECDGTPGDNDMPGRLVFMTTPDGGINASERMRIDSVGDVTIYKKINLGASGPASRIDPSSAGVLDIEADPGSNYGSSAIRFKVDNHEMARIVAGTHKNFLIGRTTTQANERLCVQNGSNQDVAFLTQSQTAQNTRNVVLLNSYAQTDFANQIVFMDHQGGIRGTIRNNTSSTQYNTSSDYRLKENEVEISDSIERIKQLKPYRFNWKNRPNTTVDGFFAHEVQDLVEDCVSGTKDGVDSNGDPEYQEMDHSKLVPLLTAAIKSLVARVEILEAA